MTWEVEVSDEFREWYNSLNEDEWDSINGGVDMIETYGPDLGRPYADAVHGSQFPNMKELRVQHRGRPYRILFAFDPRRTAYLILAGDKTGNPRWYIEAVRRADAIYERHLREIA